MPALRPLLSFTETFESSLQEKEERFIIDKALARGIMYSSTHQDKIILQL